MGIIGHGMTGKLTVAQGKGGAVMAGGAPRALTQREKAAVIVRFLLSEGAGLPLAKFPDHMQAALT